MASVKRQISDAEKAEVLAQQRRGGVLFCFASDHPIDDESEVEFHHIKPFSEDGPSEVANIGAVCKAHHRRIRTLSLSEFRDQLLMDEFFAHAEPRKLDDLLAAKTGAAGFGRQIVTEMGSGTVKLHFTNPDRPSQLSTIFDCPATQMRYFYASLPVEYVANDGDLQPRPLEQKRVWELYRHLTVHTQLAPAVCRLVGGKALLFDGQHKSAAQIWAGRKSLDCKVYIDPNVRLLKDTNLVAHDKLRQMPFFTSTLIAKYGDIFKQEWEDYLERPGTKSEADFLTFLKARGRKAVDAKKLIDRAIEQDIIEDPGNEMSQYIAERNRTKKSPFSINMLERTFFREFLAPTPADVEFESDGDHRQDEKRHVIRLMSTIAKSQLVGKWNPDAGNPAHMRAERIFSAGAMRAWVPMLRSVIAQVLNLYDDTERERVFFRQVSDQQWLLIEGRIEQLFAHKVWDDPDPEVAAQLKVNEVDQVKNFLAARGLNAQWVLGGAAV